MTFFTCCKILELFFDYIINVEAIKDTTSSGLPKIKVKINETEDFDPFQNVKKQTSSAFSQKVKEKMNLDWDWQLNTFLKPNGKPFFDLSCNNSFKIPMPDSGSVLSGLKYSSSSNSISFLIFPFLIVTGTHLFFILLSIY